MERKASVVGLKRTATWIDKGINLRMVLKEPRALKAFQVFAASIKAEENVSFWVAVEFFRVQHISTPKTGERLRKRFSETLKGPIEDVEEIFHSDPRHSVMMDQLLSMDKVRAMELTDTQVALLTDAARIFRTFLEDGAAHWTCVDMKIVDEVRNHLKKGEVDINIFSKAQTSVYQTMNSDIFPRFVKAILENPHKYSTGEKFELPQETIEQLEKLTV